MFAPKSLNGINIIIVDKKIIILPLNKVSKNRLQCDKIINFDILSKL